MVALARSRPVQGKRDLTLAARSNRVYDCLSPARSPDRWFDPIRQRLRHFSHDFRILAPGARRYVKRMIGILEQLECGARAELSHQRLQEPQGRELIASSLHEEHRDLHTEEVLSALVGRLPGRM